MRHAVHHLCGRRTVGHSSGAYRHPDVASPPPTGPLGWPCTAASRMARRDAGSGMFPARGAFFVLLLKKEKRDMWQHTPLALVPLSETLPDTAGARALLSTLVPDDVADRILATRTRAPVCRTCWRARRNEHSPYCSTACALFLQ